MDATESFLLQDIARLATPHAIKIQMDLVIKQLAQLPLLIRPYAKVLKGKCDGLIELRFEFRNVMYRPLGYYPGQRRVFTIVMMAREINSDWVPKDACKIARTRKKLIDSDPTRVRDYQRGLHGVLAPKRDR